MNENESMSDLVEYRISVYADVLQLMEEKEDLPLPNKYLLARTAKEYFYSEGFVDDVRERYEWAPQESYFLNHTKEVSDLLARKRGKFFFYHREWGDIRGLWLFGNKKEYEIALRREYADVATRTYTYNDRLDRGQGKWKLEIPSIAEVPLLGN